MSDTVRDLVDAMVAKDALATETAFGAAMAEKLGSKLDDMRVDVAKNMFATQEELDFEPVEDEVDIVDEVDETVEDEVEDAE
jgi:hypothetical protein